MLPVCLCARGARPLPCRCRPGRHPDHSQARLSADYVRQLAGFLPTSHGRRKRDQSRGRGGDFGKTAGAASAQRVAGLGAGSGILLDRRRRNLLVVSTDCPQGRGAPPPPHPAPWVKPRNHFPGDPVESVQSSCDLLPSGTRKRFVTIPSVARDLPRAVGLAFQDVQVLAAVLYGLARSFWVEVYRMGAATESPVARRCDLSLTGRKLKRELIVLGLKVRLNRFLPADRWCVRGH